MDDLEHRIPYADTLTYPDPVTWAEISQRIGVFTTTDEEREDPDILAIKNKLETVPIDLDFKDAALVDIIDFIRDYADINIVVDEEVRDAGTLEEVTSFRVNNLPLKSTLKLLLGNFELTYAFRDKVLMITTPENSGGTSVLEIHDIRDLMVKISDFPGPQVELKPPGDAGGGVGGATFSLEEEREAISEEQIEDLIRENVAPGTWDLGDNSLTLTPNQQLLVNHTPATQREVRNFLSKLRRYSGAMVMIDAKFVAAHDNFLEDVGNQIVEAGGPTVGDGVGGGGGADPAGAGGAGYFTNGTTADGTWDFRARLLHTFTSVDAAGNPQDAFALGNRLTNEGGIGIEYNFLGDDTLNMVMRAVKKEEQATIVQAPQITVFNTQRSNITVVTQRAYIGDYEVAVSTFAAFFDPVVMYVQDGVVLDVRPIISHDRKYVQLELRPAFADFQLFRTLAPFGGITLNLQLPFIIFQKAEMTVRVPDRGTLLVSGFKDILSRDLYGEMPFFGNIPILNFFLSRKAHSTEKRRLLLLVTPEIIDLGEHEAEIEDVTVDRFPYKR
jgi:type II secretory pathway component GspD/PulD (secretin)